MRFLYSGTFPRGGDKVTRMNGGAQISAPTGVRLMKKVIDKRCRGGDHTKMWAPSYD